MGAHRRGFLQPERASPGFLHRIASPFPCLARVATHIASLPASRDMGHSDYDKLLTFFSRRFRKEFASDFVENSVLTLPLSKPCAVPFALHFTEQSTFRGGGGESPKRFREKGRKRGGQQRGQKKKRGRVKTSRAMTFDDVTSLHVTLRRMRWKLS